MITAMSMAQNPMATMAQGWTAAFEQGLGFWMHQNRVWAEAMRASANVSVGDITIYLPFGQGFSQDIDPRTNWGWMTGAATVWPEIEEQIVRRAASYGVQLDKISALLLDIAEHVPEADAEKRADLEELARKIENVKQEHGRI